MFNVKMRRFLICACLRNGEIATTTPIHPAARFIRKSANRIRVAENKFTNIEYNYK